MKKNTKIIISLIVILLVAYPLIYNSITWEGPSLVETHQLYQNSEFSKVHNETNFTIPLLEGREAKNFLESDRIIERCGKIIASKIQYIDTEEGTWILKVNYWYGQEVVCDYVSL